ncbi:MAG: FMN-binding protein [Butyricimonas faecalis]
MGLTLLDNSESPGFLRRLEKKNLFSAWDGKTLEEAALLNVEAVSGATMSSDAIRGSVKRALEFYLERDGGGFDMDWVKLLQHVLGGIVVLLALASMFWGSRMKRWRYVLQVASVLILGFWSGYFVSLELLFNWLLNGIPWGARILLPVIAVLALAFPLFLNKAYYARFMSFGAAQELLGKVRKKKIAPKGVWKSVFKHTRVIYFMVIRSVVVGYPVGFGVVGTFSGIFIDRCNGVGDCFCHIFTFIRILCPSLV